jgi:tetratricopeptide (TPR) repeat protein
MSSFKVRIVSLALLGALAMTAHAGDAEAQKLLQDAQKHWSDPTPAEAVRLAQAALDAKPTNQALLVNVQLFLGKLHQKDGEFDKALAQFDAIIQALVGTEDPLLRQLKADAMCSKGTIVYSEKDDPAAALQLYQSAHRTFQLATTIDTVSQLAFRMGRDPARTEADRKTFMDLALGAAREAVTLAPRQFPNNEDRRVANLNKCKLQLVIVLTALADPTAAQVWSEVQQDKLGDACLYQRAILHALKGEAEPATEALKKSLHLPVRAIPSARNQLRKFIRTEPDFAALRSRPDWKDLIEDERADR